LGYDNRYKPILAYGVLLKTDGGYIKEAKV